MQKIKDELLAELNNKGLIIKFIGMRWLKPSDVSSNILMEFKWTNIQFNFNFEIEFIPDSAGQLKYFGIYLPWLQPFEIIMNSSKLITDNYNVYEFFKQCKTEVLGLFIFSTENKIASFMNEIEKDTINLAEDLVQELVLYEKIEQLCRMPKQTISIFLINGEEFMKYYDVVVANVTNTKILRIDGNYLKSMKNWDKENNPDIIKYLIQKSSKLSISNKAQDQKAKAKLLVLRIEYNPRR